MSETWPRNPPSLEARLALVSQALTQVTADINELIAEIRAEQAKGDADVRRAPRRRGNDPVQPDPGAGNPR